MLSKVINLYLVLIVVALVVSASNLISTSVLPLYELLNKIALEVIIAILLISVGLIFRK